MSLDDVILRLLRAAVFPGEQIVVVYENSKSDIERSCFRAADKLGCSFVSFNLDSFGERPLSSVPQEVVDAIMEADLFLQFIDKYSNEEFDEFITVRNKLIVLKYENKKLRVGQLLSVNSDLFSEIFSYNPNEIVDLNFKLLDLITNSREIVVKSRSGTDLKFEVGDLSWINQDADLRKPSSQHSLLAGEVYGCPGSVNGVAVIDGVMGGEFMKYDLEKTPVRIKIVDSRIVSFTCKNSELVERFFGHLKKYKNSEKVGELGFGTNIGLKKFYRILGVDEKFPGVHIAFGNPYPKKTGADWGSEVHIDCVMRNVDAWVGSTKVLENSKYLI